MKDAYSFHTSQDDLDKYYERCFQAYERFFCVGIPETISVASDSGMISGSISHEFMLLKPVGEDSIVTCGNCDYRANMETAESIVENETSDIVTPLEKIHTPGMKTIEDVCDFLKIPILNSYKAVVYQKDITNEYTVVFIRGDLDVNETKLKNYLHKKFIPPQ